MVKNQVEFSSFCIKPIKSGKRECVITKKVYNSKFKMWKQEQYLYKAGTRYYDPHSNEELDLSDPRVVAFEEALRTPKGVIKSSKWIQTSKHNKVNTCVRIVKNLGGIEVFREFFRYKIDEIEGKFSGGIEKKKYTKDDMMYIGVQLRYEGVTIRTMAMLFGVTFSYVNRVLKIEKMDDNDFKKVEKSKTLHEGIDYM